MSGTANKENVVSPSEYMSIWSYYQLSFIQSDFLKKQQLRKSLITPLLLVRLELFFCGSLVHGLLCKNAPDHDACFVLYIHII